MQLSRQHSKLRVPLAMATTAGCTLHARGCQRRYLCLTVDFLRMCALGYIIIQHVGLLAVSLGT